MEIYHAKEKKKRYRRLVGVAASFLGGVSQNGLGLLRSVVEPAKQLIRLLSGGHPSR
ncbi:hypothetical protein [Bradyrhizobium macuxiense]|uniref:hypothetical protein n=1 Tax=Bradyrhizobium macuxiense TaxID=1755647 RepID=UPI000ABAA50F|nr:hypothetical protein [Bradyrhizobium macuxiense]